MRKNIFSLLLMLTALNLFSVSAAAKDRLQVHFLDVGQADSTLITLDDHIGSLDYASFTILGPVNDYGEELNDWSIALRLTYGNTSFLFTGDAESTVLWEGENITFLPEETRVQKETVQSLFARLKKK